MHRVRKGRAFATVALATSLACGLAVGVTGAAHAGATTIDPTYGAAVTSGNDCATAPPIANYSLANDPYSVDGIAKEIGAEDYYTHGYFGQGVDVALIDSGVADTKGLKGGNVVNAVDLSFDAQAPYATDPAKRDSDLPYHDCYGHGTHMASIIAGRDNPVPQNPAGFNWQDPSAFRGIAPESRVVNVKVADGMGAVDVTQLAAGVDWVVQHKDTDGLHIRVLNLSVGITAKSRYQYDVLTHAVDEAWRAGIVVVAAAGNGGLDAPGYFAKLPTPGFDPNIIAVGSYNTQGTLGDGNHEDDTSSDFTQRGISQREVDIVAPGEHVMGIHVPGAHADEEIVKDCVATVKKQGSWGSPIAGTSNDDANVDRFVRGSGTSQAAAVVSGAVALMLSRSPSMSQNDVKLALLQTGRRLQKNRYQADGKGELNLSAADGIYGITDPTTGLIPDSTRRPRHLPVNDPAIGGMSLAISRGKDPLPCKTMTSVHKNRGKLGNNGYSGGLCSAIMNLRSAIAENHAVESDIFGHYIPTNRADGNLPAAEHAHTAWQTRPDGGESWMGGPEWIGPKTTVNGLPQWQTKQWDVDWTGARWSDWDWSGARWSGARWSGARWSDQEWSGARWSTDALRGARWSGARWSGDLWRDESWH